jgi:DNA-binding response OmpR family regulator
VLLEKEGHVKKGMMMKLILMVEDDVQLQTMLADLIDQETPHLPIVVGSGEEALAIMDEIIPDLVVLDYLLPDMNGMALYDRLRQRTALREVPAFFLSANLTQATVFHQLDQRDLKALAKPFDVSVLLDWVEHELTQSDARRRQEVPHPQRTATRMRRSHHRRSQSCS